MADRYQYAETNKQTNKTKHLEYFNRGHTPVSHKRAESALGEETTNKQKREKRTKKGEREIDAGRNARVTQASDAITRHPASNRLHKQTNKQTCLYLIH